MGVIERCQSTWVNQLHGSIGRDHEVVKPGVYMHETTGFKFSLGLVELMVRGIPVTWLQALHDLIEHSLRREPRTPFDHDLAHVVDASEVLQSLTQQGSRHSAVSPAHPNDLVRVLVFKHGSFSSLSEHGSVFWDADLLFELGGCLHESSHEGSVHTCSLAMTRATRAQSPAKA